MFPLGGNQRNLFISLIIIITTMSIAGLWHGPGLNFLIWGSIWGLYIYLARFYQHAKLPKYITIPVTFIIVSILWILFRSSDLKAAADYYMVLFAISDGIASNATFYEQRNILPLAIIACLGLGFFHLIEFKLQSIKFIKSLIKNKSLIYSSLVVTLLILIAVLPSNNNYPFIYFRF